MKTRRNGEWEREQWQVVDAEQGPSDDDLTLVVSGEFLPGEEAEREATAPGRALVPVREPTIEEMLEAFRRWMRLDVADGNASPHTLRTYF